MDKNLARLTLETIRVVYMVLQKKNLTSVSMELGITQPAVSFHVKKFEGIFGRKIIYRVGNNLVADTDARVIMEICENILRSGCELEEFTGANRDDRQSIGICPDVFALMAPNSASHFNIFERYRVIVDQSTTLASRFSSGELQAVFRPLDPVETQPDLTVKVWFRWIGANKTRSVSGANSSVPIILDSGRSAYAALARLCLSDLERPYKVVAEINEWEVMRELLQSGLGYALLPSFRADQFKGALDGDAKALGTGTIGTFGLFYHQRGFPLTAAMHLFDGVSHAIGPSRVEELHVM